MGNFGWHLSCNGPVYVNRNKFCREVFVVRNIARKLNLLNIVSSLLFFSVQGFAQSLPVPTLGDFVPELVKSFQDSRLVKIEKGRNLGSGVYLGKYNIAYESPTGQVVQYDQAAVFATNYHVNGKTPGAYISFVRNFTELKFRSEHVLCSIKKDLCLLIVSERQAKLVDKTEVLNQERLEFVSSKDVLVSNELYFLGRKGVTGFFSKGTVTHLFPDSEGYFSSQQEDKKIAVMMSTTAKLDRGMSGGATIDSQGRLLGINSFFTPREQASDSKDRSFFLPTDWILEILKNPYEYDSLMHIDRVETGTFWMSFEDWPQFLRDQYEMYRKH